MTREGEKVVPIVGERLMLIKHLHYIAGHVLPLGHVKF